MKKSIKLCQHVGNNTGSAKAMLSPDGDFVGLDIEYRLDSYPGTVNTLHLPISPDEARQFARALRDEATATEDRRPWRPK
jgi:hypothetical protein